MIAIKTAEEIQILSEVGGRLRLLLHYLSGLVAPGISTMDLEHAAASKIGSGVDKPAFMGYKPAGAKNPYPANICVSVNDEIVHGIPSLSRVLKSGDIVGIDVGLEHAGLIVDSAITVAVGEIGDKETGLIHVTKSALDKGIEAAKIGNTVGDIGYAISNFVRPHGYGIIEELCGHGVGYALHEEPYVPNFGKKGGGVLLKAGIVIAIEPMLTLGGKKIKLDKDGYTYRTADGSKAAHFEHTVAITENGPRILTI